MNVTKVTWHAIERFQQRVHQCDYIHAKMLLLEACEQGRAAVPNDFEIFGTWPRPGLDYRFYRGYLLVIDPMVGAVITIIAQTRFGHPRRPALADLRGQPVREALAMFYQDADV